jgi:hypothetical protein
MGFNDKRSVVVFTLESRSPTCHRDSAGRLVNDVLARRSGLGDGPALGMATGPVITDPSWRARGVGAPTLLVAELAVAWLTGRLVPTDLPELPRWLSETLAVGDDDDSADIADIADIEDRRGDRGRRHRWSG